MNKPLLALGASAVLVMGIPAIASAHTATVVCDQNTGSYIVTPTNLDLHPVWRFGGTTLVEVRWDDGYTKTLKLPQPCEAPVPFIPTVIPDTPVTTVPVTIPVPVPVPVPVPPPTCAELQAQYPKAGLARQRSWGCVIPNTSILRTVKTVHYACVVGGRSKTVITVTLPSGKIGKVVKYGKVCKIPAVAG